MNGEVARVHVDDFDPEVFTGEDALRLANVHAQMLRSDFPGAVIGVSYNPQAAVSARLLAGLSFRSESGDLA